MRVKLMPAIVAVVLSSFSAIGAEIEGQLLGGGAPIAKSTVTLWSAGADAPRQLGQAQTGDDGRFTLSFQNPSGPEGISYLVAKGGEPTARRGGDNPAIAMLSVLGNTPGQSHRQRDDYCGVGVDPRAIP